MAHSHTKRALPEVLQAMAGPLEQLCMLNSHTLNMTMLCFIHIIFTTNPVRIRETF